jgi:phosphonopyruvate decarboxylase
LSLADPDVYSIPLILVIGWRGEPGVKDEPQHRKQGRIMLSMLAAMEIPYAVVPQQWEEAEDVVRQAVRSARVDSAPRALIVRKGTFESCGAPPDDRPRYPLVREDAIKAIVDALEASDVVVATTGMTSRELFEYRVARGDGHQNDFLTVGGMGHTSHIAMGIAIQRPNRLVFCLDGDGSVLMHMGSLAINGSLHCSNFKHVVLNNGAHDSVGGQPTVGFDIDIPTVAKAVGYQLILRAETPAEIDQGIRELRTQPGTGLMEVRVNKGSRPDLGRPTTTPVENKEALMKALE